MKAALLIKLGHTAFPERRELIEPGNAVLCSWAFESHFAGHHHAPAHTESLQHAGHRFAQFRTGHPDELRAGPRRIQERPEKIEEGALAALGTNLPCGRDLLERRVIFGREEKCELMFAQRLRGLRWIEIDANPQGFEH